MGVEMAQNRAEIARRHRLHSAGDHSECSPARCAELIRRNAVPNDAIGHDSTARGLIDALAADHQGKCSSFACDALIHSAVLLADQLDNGGGVRVSTEFRQTLNTLRGCRAEPPKDTDDPIDILRWVRAFGGGTRYEDVERGDSYRCTTPIDGDEV
jgi:hypothetical protein